MRGLSGSGKTSEAWKIYIHESKKFNVKDPVPLEELDSDAVISYCSADEYFMKDGVYKYDYSRIGDAHDFCLRKYLKSLSSLTNRVIIVDNTNTETWEYTPYTALARVYGFEICIIEVYRDILACIRDNNHRVPSNVIKEQLRRFEPTQKGLNTRVVIIGQLPNRLTRLFRWIFRIV
jgi:tRNA uridine 5-carbamoylmethylation protein Kti12